MSCLAVVPIGLGPTVVAFAGSARPSTTEPTATTEPAPTPTVPSTTVAPDTTASTTPVPTTPPVTTAVATSTTVAPAEPPTATSTSEPSPDTSTPDTSTPGTSTPGTSTPENTTPGTSTPASTTIDPASTVTPSTSVPTAASSTTVDQQPATTDAGATPAASSTVVPTSDATGSAGPESTTTIPTSTSTTITTPGPLRAPAPPSAAPPNTMWTLGLRYLGGTTYTGTFDLYLRARFGGTTVELTDGQVSLPLERRTGFDEYVRVEMGSSYVAAFPFTWECTGDVSGTQIGTTQQFTPAVDAMDATMDCVFIIDNTNPPVVDVISEVLGDDTGTVSFDYSIDYASYDRVNVTSFGGGDGTTGSAAGLAGFSLGVTATDAATNPPNVQSTARCVDAGGGYVSNGYSGSVSTPRDHMTSGARITCTFTHVVPSTLTIIEDVVPDDSTAPAADYSITRFRTIENLSAWQLSDGQTQTFTLRPDYSGNATITRTEVPGWDLDRVDCVHDVGGSVQPYTDYDVTLGSTSGRAAFPSPPPGTDIVCTFVAVPAGAPSVLVKVEPNVIDESAYDDFVVEVRDDGGSLLQTITAAPSGGAQTEPLPSGGTYAVTIINPQGLDITWTCDGVVTTDPIASFPTILGETADCTLALVEPIPTGTTTLSLRKNEDPDYFYFQNYGVEVNNGDYRIASGVIAEDEPALVITGLAAQTLTITETSRNSGYELASVVCTNVVSTSPITRRAYIDGPTDGNLIREGVFSIDFVDGVDIDCLLTNSPSTATSILRVETITDPAASSQQFDYSIDPAALVPVDPTFSQGDGDEASREVAGGEFYTVTQSPVAGFATESACFPTSGIPFYSDDLEAGTYVENDVDYTCRFINTFAPASLTVGVDVEPDDPAIDTQVSVDRAGSYVATDDTTISGDGSVVASTLVDGTYTISLEYPYAQHVTGVVGVGCTQGVTTVQTVGGVPTTRTTIITAEISGGADVSCTATLEVAPQVAQITVVTDVPHGLAPTAGYDVAPSADVIGAATFAHIGSDSSTFDVDIGPAFTITQSLPAGYTVSAECVDALSVDVATGTSAVTFTPADADDITCTFTLTPESPTVTVRTVTVPATTGGTPAFDYAVSPDGGFSGATSPFSQSHDDETTLVLDPHAVFDPADFFGVSPYPGPGVPAITQDPHADHTTRVGCYDADTATEPASYADALVVSPALVPGQNVVCIFENRLDAPSTYSVTIDAIVSTGVVDVADRFSFVTSLAGPGLRGPIATGAPQTPSFADGDSTSVLIDAGTAITIDATDALAGADGFEYSIDCGVPVVVNAPVALTPVGDLDCTLTFEARTVTVEKFVDPVVVGGFDEFEIGLAPSVDPSTSFVLQDGDSEIVVVSLTGTPDLTELDAGPYEPSIRCTQLGFGGPVAPPTGPFGGDTVQLPDDRMSYDCDVINSVPVTSAFEITLESELDLGDVAIPRDFPGVEVEFDGDLADGAVPQFGQVPEFGPTDLTGRRNVHQPTLGAPLGNLLDTVTVSPNGTVSVFVVDGGDVTIRPSTGSEQFATSISCPAGIVGADGSVTLQNVGAATTCVMRNAAGNVTLTHTVVGPTSETSWPFTISNVVAGLPATSLGNGESVTVAVGVDAPTTMTQTDALGATSVASSCGAVSLTSLSGYRSLIDSLIDSAESVTVGGGQSVTCRFVTEYATTSPPSVPPTTVPPTTAPPTTTPGTTPVVPTSTVVPTTTVPSLPGPTVAPPGTTPQIPFAPPGATIPTIPASTTPVDTTTTTPDEPAAPSTTLPPADESTPTDTPSTTVPDEPAVVITDDPDTPDVFVDIGDPIPVDIDCDGTTTIFVNGVEQSRVDQIEPSALGLGDHVIEVRCDDETITEVRAVVFEQDEGAPAGSNMTVIVMFVVMAVGAFVFAPSAAGRKRLAL
jgi:hypothetical protein